MEKLLQEIAVIPDTPFLYKPAQEWVKKTISSKKIRNLSLAEDGFALYVRVKRGNPTKKIIVVSHLDHPGIVFADGNYGLPLGSIRYDKSGNYDIKQILLQLRKGLTPVKVYKPNGQFQQTTIIKGVSIKNGIPIVSVNATKPVSPNSFGIWDTPIFQNRGGIIRMRNADNNAATVIAIKLLLESNHLNNINLEVVFTYLEEVVQISSTAIAKRGSTLFGPITKDDLVINLDPMEIEIGQTEKAIIRRLHLEEPNYNDGIIIKANDRNLIYGLFFNEVNLAESILRQGVSKLKFPHQNSITCNSTDAKSFSLFPLTPHIATIAIPCRYKHNQGPKGQFVAEEIYKRDLNNTLRLLKWLLTQKYFLPDTTSQSQNLKQLNYGLSIKEAIKLRKEQTKAIIAARPRLRKGIYFGRNIIEKLDINFWRIISKLS